MDGVVTKQFRFFEGQEVIFLGEGGDPFDDARKGNTGDKNPVELLDQNGARQPRRHRRKFHGADKCRVAMHPAHLADHRVENLQALHAFVRVALLELFVQHFGGVVVVLARVQELRPRRVEPWASNATMEFSPPAV